MNTKSMKNNIARGVARLAEKQVRNSVGKSLPLGLHELKVPDEVLKKLGK